MKHPIPDHNPMRAQYASQASHTPRHFALAVAEGVATVTLNRPAHRNRLHDEDLATLLAHFDTVRATPAVHALVLTAHPNQPNPVFSAGYHVGEFDAAGNTGAMPFERVPDALAALPVPTLCALTGSVYGGATDLALACDFRFGVSGMQLRMPAAALGLHYYPSGMKRYLARLGLGAARRLFLTAQPVDDHELLAMGFLDRLLPADQLDAAVHAWATHMAALAPLAVQGMKQTLNDMALGEGSEALWREREELSKRSRDFAEGRAAFGEKREARFSGE